jgi:hypothetical protein
MFHGNKARTGQHFQGCLEHGTILIMTWDREKQQLFCLVLIQRGQGLACGPTARKEVNQGMWQVWCGP